MSQERISEALTPEQLRVLREFTAELILLAEQRGIEKAKWDAWKAACWTPEIRAERRAEIEKAGAKKCRCGGRNPRYLQLQLDFERDAHRACYFNFSGRNDMGDLAIGLLDDGLLDALEALDLGGSL